MVETYSNMGSPELRAQGVVQSPHDLVLAVHTEALTVPLDILAQSSVELHGHRLTWAIIGESHTVRVEQAGRVVLHEVFACVDLAGQVCRHQQHFRGLDAHRYGHAGYTIAVAFDRPAWSVPAACDGHLEFAFALTHGRVPVTRIDWQQDGDALRWWTLHTYPEAGGVREVYTYSELLLTLEEGFQRR